MDGPDTLPEARLPTTSLQALVDLAHTLSSSARFEDVLHLAAEGARAALGVDSLSLSRWERDRAQLRTLVNVGRAQDRYEHFPQDEVYPVAEYWDTLDLERHGAVVHQRHPQCPPVALAMLERLDRESMLSAAVDSAGRVWGEMLATTTSGSRVLDPADLPLARQVAAIVGQIIADAEQLQRLTHLAFQDPLTGVANRRVLDDTLTSWLAPQGPGATVMLCDVNGLKIVNDTHGHEAGDRAIVTVADCLASATSHLPGAVLARIGGDEFAVLLPGSSLSTAIEVVESAARRLQQAADPGTVSCGVAAAPAGSPPRALLAAADDAQYAAKRRGAQVVVSSSPGADRAQQPATRQRWVAPARRVRRPDAGTSATVEAALSAVAEGLGSRREDPPAGTAERLAWLGERLMAPCSLQRWTVSGAGESGELTTLTMGLLHARGPGWSETDLLLDTAFRLVDYPVTARAIAADAVFTVVVDDEAADPAERAVLVAMGVSYVVGVGVHTEDADLLLELHGDSSSISAPALSDLLTVTAGAVLQRPVRRLADLSDGPSC